jgi:hypothetical protein
MPHSSSPDTFSNHLIAVCYQMLIGWSCAKVATGQAEKGLRDGRTLASGMVLTMGIDDVTQRPPADMPAEEQRVEPPVRAELEPPSVAERIEAHLQARQATDKAYAERIGAEISSGHAFDKHVTERGEFPGVTTREQFVSVIADAVMKGESRALNSARTAYWSDGTVVIRHPGTEDGGTAFRPASGYDYFLGLN